MLVSDIRKLDLGWESWEVRVWHLERENGGRTFNQFSPIDLPRSDLKSYYMILILLDRVSAYKYLLGGLNF